MEEAGFISLASRVQPATAAKERDLQPKEQQAVKRVLWADISEGDKGVDGDDIYDYDWGTCLDRPVKERTGSSGLELTPPKLPRHEPLPLRQPQQSHEEWMGDSGLALTPPKQQQRQWPHPPRQPLQPHRTGAKGNLCTRERVVTAVVVVLANGVPSATRSAGRAAGESSRPSWASEGGRGSGSARTLHPGRSGMDN